MAATALQALADTPPKHYLNLQSGSSSTRQSILRHIYEQCASAALVPSTAADDIARLHAIFDVALEHGLGSLVNDYLEEVCWDRHMTSSDPIEAFLLDAECVRRWCHKTLTVSRGRLTTWLSGGLTSLSSTSSRIQKELGKLRILQNIIAALAEPEGQAENKTSNEADEAVRLVQCAQVAAWLASAKLNTDRSSGRFGSEQEWRTIAARRRDSCAPQSLFVADMLTILQGDYGVEGVQYPPASLERLIPALFLSGSTELTAWHTKLGLLTYCLVDGAFLPSHVVVDGLTNALHVSLPLAYSWLLQLYCDDTFSMPAGSPQSLHSLNQAADFVPAVDGAALPFKALHIFLAKGRPDTALSLLLQRSDTTTSLTLSEASTALSIRLANGLLVEAFMGMKRYLVHCADDEERSQHADVLVDALMRWAAAAGMLHVVMRLPFGFNEEEQSLLRWLRAKDAETAQAGVAIVLFYLMRGRTPEALEAFGKHCRGRKVFEPADEGAISTVERLLGAADKALPAIQREALYMGGGSSDMMLDGLHSGAADSILLGSISHVLARSN